VQKRVIGDEQPIDCRPADLLPPGMEQARQEIGELAQSEEDVLSYALFPQVARPFLERRAKGGAGTRERALIAAIAARLVAQAQQDAETATREHAAAAEKQGVVPSPWKTAWRPQAGRWGGLIDGAGGAR
jgi:pyruvate/oxaloacetate carboxyltransferase